MGNSKSSLVMETLMRGDIESVEACLKRKEDPNKGDKFGRTPLMFASYFGHVDVVKLLIQYKAHVNLVPRDSQNQIWPVPFFFYDPTEGTLEYNFRSHNSWTDRLYLVSKLDKGVKYNWTSLLYASYQGHDNVVKLLVENGAQIDAKDDIERTALYLASEEGHLEVVQCLLKKGAAVDTMDKEGFTPLTVASKNGHSNVVRSLLRNGANIEHVTEFDVTPLRAAIDCGSSDVVRALIENGANLNKRDNTDGSTPLHDCCLLGRSAIITTLLDGGANINALNNDGKSALDLVIEERNQIDALDNDWKSVLEKENWAISDILLDRGAKFGNDIQNEEQREKVSNMNDRLKRFQNELKSVLTEKDEAVNEKIEEIAKLKLKYEEEIARLKKKQQEDADAKEVYSIALDLLIDQEDRKSDEISFLEKKLNESKEEWDLVIEEKNRELEELQTKISDLTEDKHLLKDENTTLSQEVEKLNKDLEQSKADLQSAKTSHTYYNSTVYNQKGENNWTRLMEASRRGDLKEVELRLLIDNGARIDKRDLNGNTALRLASENDHLQVVKCLHEKGAAVDETEFFGLIPALIDNGASVNVRDEHGRTPLHYSCLGGHVEITKNFIIRGATINTYNHMHISPLDLAVKNRHWSTSEILLDRGAKFGSEMQNEELRETLSKLNDRVKNFQDQLNSALSEKEEAEKQMEETMEEIAKLKMQHQKDSDALEFYLSVLEKQRKQQEELLIEENNTKSSKITELEAEIKETKRQLDLVMEEKNKKSNQISILEEELSGMKKQRDLVAEKRNGELEELQAKIADLTANEQLFRSENMAVSEEVDKLKIDLEQMKRDFQSAKTGTTFKDCTIKVEKGSTLAFQTNVE